MHDHAGAVRKGENGRKQVNDDVFRRQRPGGEAADAS
jgi:hypothetical protein